MQRVITIVRSYYEVIFYNTRFHYCCTCTLYLTGSDCAVLLDYNTIKVAVYNNAN